jgi:subtilisin-like proprotein convertase family protein/subtilisin family serine protease
MTYTYRGGRRIELEKRPDEFVARAEPDRLRDAGIDATAVSPASSRAHASPAELETAMARSRDVAPTHHAYAVADTGQDFLITDRVFVTFKDALPDEKVASFAGGYGLLQRERYSDRDFLFQLTDHTGMNPVKLVVKLTEDEPLVERAENDLNYLAPKTTSITLPSDPEYARQWHLHGHLNHPDVDPRSNSRCEAAWLLLDSFGSHDVVVGVTDDGCRLDHSDFDSPDKFASWGYFRGTRLVKKNDVDAVPTGMYEAGANHGTSCAGVIAGEADAALTVGGAPGCRLLPIKWESQGPSLMVNDSKFLTALSFVADKIDVLSNSWGIVPLNHFATLVVNRIASLAQTGGRRGRGILFLWAAGNDNCPINHVSNVDVPYTDGWGLVAGSWRWVGVDTSRRFENSLVGIPGVMHVAALASTAKRSHYSNYGSGISLCAPTSNSHAFWRMNVAGLGVTTTTGETARVTHDFGGTSSATPLAAGIAALVISANPTLTALEVAAVLRSTARKDLDAAAYPRTPPANYDPNPVWDISPVVPFESGAFRDIGHADGTWSPWFGHGCIDAEAAVARALEGLPVSPPAGEPAGHRVTPDLPIPDNDPTGRRSVIRVNDPGTLRTIRVGARIAHPYIGDLVVTLIAPSGRSVRLHDRSGGSANDLDAMWDTASLPGLRAFDGEALAGDWTLWVQDLAVADIGRLQAWSLEVTRSTDDIALVSDAPGATIPDNQPAGITRTVAVAGGGRVGGIEVEVDITHTYIGDLRVVVRSPSGREVFLHDRGGGSTDNLRATYRSSAVTALAAMHGEPASGDWSLRVVDVAAQDIGKLNRWALKLTRQPAAVPASEAPRWPPSNIPAREP